MSETTQTFKNYIGGEWVAAADGRTTENRDPATGALLGHFPRSGQADVDRAVAAAKAAFEGWRRTPAPKRGEILYRVGALLAERKEEIARILTSEMGKVLVEARGDVQEAIDMAYYMAGEGRRLFGAIVPSELPNKAAYGVRDPLGVIACVTPWNFPTAIPSWKSMAALIAGNTVVLKPATDTPHSALKLVEAFADAGLPPGALNLVMGSGSEVGMPLVQHPDVAGISFTGSNEVGREVNVEAARGLQAGDAGAGRQERDHRDGRRRSRSGRRGHPVERVRHDGAALHRMQPADRAEGRAARVGGATGRARDGAAAGAWVGRADAGWPAHQHGPARARA